jgi:hypothetical protein
MLERKLKLGFNIDKISKFMLKHLIKDVRTLEDRAYDYIIEYVEKNISKSNRNTYCEADRYYRKRKISKEGNVVKVIILKVEVPYVETEEMRNEYYKMETEKEKQKEDKKEAQTIDIEEIDKILDKNE